MFYYIKRNLFKFNPVKSLKLLKNSFREYRAIFFGVEKGARYAYSGKYLAELAKIGFEAIKSDNKDKLSENSDQEK
jgi:hypothetical protein